MTSPLLGFRAPLRKQIPEPVSGIIKSVMGFRQFLLRGLENVQGRSEQWSLSDAVLGLVPKPPTS